MDLGMTDLLAARSQMAMSLGFHIIFAMVGIAMPVLMVVAERRWQRTGDRIYLDLAHRWAKGTAILFAVGAVSGTVLSFELGLLWPTFMEHAGPVIGMPFSLEGFAFFTEAVFLGVYLYGWDRISRRAHMTLAAYASTGLVVAGIHAWPLLRHPRNAFHRRALSVALLIGAPAALLQPVSGDLSARFVAHWQPVKLAAMEGHFKTERGAPLRIGGWPDEAAGETRYAIEIPYGLSLLAFKDPTAEVKGLLDFPRQDWPPVAIVHVAFQVMVGLGSYMALVSAAALWLMWRRRELTRHRWLLRALVLAAPMGFICAEAGWIVTEVGRQPWIIHGIMRTAEAVTPIPGLVVPFLVFTGLYAGLGVVVAWLLHQQVLRSPEATEEDAA